MPLDNSLKKNNIMEIGSESVDLSRGKRDEEPILIESDDLEMTVAEELPPSFHDDFPIAISTKKRKVRQ